uniref:Uncharacterized protein n=1 Tax=Romanomermis culicivorax TaxID=13658 RepID=A0A915JTP7_ROMCU
FVIAIVRGAAVPGAGAGTPAIINGIRPILNGEPCEPLLAFIDDDDVKLPPADVDKFRPPTAAVET